jgi:general L-amino acid transport system permease protein
MPISKVMSGAEAGAGEVSMAPPVPTIGVRIARTIFGPDNRLVLPQILFLVFLFLGLGALVWIVSTNLERFGIGSGFGFLDRQAGFDITQSLIAYSPQATYGRAFVIAFLNTLALSACVIVLATLLGIAIGLVGLSPNKMAAGLAVGYIEIVRNIPLLLHILFWYFAVLRPLPGPRQGLSAFDIIFLNNRGLYVPSLSIAGGLWPATLGIIAAALWIWWARRRYRAGGRPLPVFWPSISILAAFVAVAIVSGAVEANWTSPELAGFNIRGGAVILPEFVAMVASLTVYGAAFIAEIIRGGIASVPKGQREASRSLGLRPGQTYRLVILPQALRVIIPPLTNQYLDIVKNSSLGAVIAYPDLMLVFGGTVLNQTNQPLEVMTIIIVVYLTINFVIATLMNLYNKANLLKER